jgi:multidrug resistance protein, MATE family
MTGTDVANPGGSELGALFWLGLPVMGLNLLSVLALFVDAAMCSRLPDATVVLSGLGYAIQLVFLLTVFMIGLSVGAVSLVARAVGAGDHERVSRLLQQATTLTVLLGVAVAVAGNLLAESLLGALGASDAAARVSTQYLRPMLAAAGVNYLALLYTGVMRGLGNTRAPFVCALIANVVNAAVNYCLIYGHLGLPALGVRGAAIGTILSHVVNASLLAHALGRAIPGVRLRLRPRSIDHGLMLRIIRIGGPAAVDVLILNFIHLGMIAMLARIDQVAVAAHVVGMRIQGLAFVPALGISQATAALIGQSLGAGDVSRARRVTTASLVLCCAVLIGLCAAMVVFARPLLHLFDVQPGSPLEDYGVQCLVLGAVANVPFAIYIAFLGVMQGSGTTRTALLISTVSVFLVQIPVGLALGFTAGLGATGVWWSLPAANLVRVGMALAAHHRGRWAANGVGPPDRG